MKTANKNTLSYVGSKPGNKNESRDSDSWYTPKSYIDSARKVLGNVFCLDPFSSDLANETVKAKSYYTIDDDALSRTWHVKPVNGIKTVWMNPPYGQTMGEACRKFIEEFRKGSFDEGIVLTNNATETIWFAILLQEASCVCFTDHRIRFEAFDGKTISGNTRGQTFFYFGKNKTQFKNHFMPYGHILVKSTVSKKYGGCL